VRENLFGPACASCDVPAVFGHFMTTHVPSQTSRICKTNLPMEYLRDYIYIAKLFRFHVPLYLVELKRSVSK
jgi:hypothetical protein